MNIRTSIAASATLLGLSLWALAPAHADSKPKTHDGFHFQTQLGLGYYKASIDDAADSNISGTTIPIAFLFGGNVSSKLIIGGGLVLDRAPSPSFESNGTSFTPDGVTQYIVGLGAYADYYMDPVKNGLHFQGYAGWGGLETSNNGNAGGSDPTGLVTYIGGGYDWWISDQWSAGVMGRLLYGPFSQNSISVTTIEPAVVGALTWH